MAGLTIGNPATLIQALASQRIYSGDTLELLPGTYTGDYIIPFSGHDTQPITIKAHTPGTVTIDGSFSFYGKNFIVDGLEFTRTDWQTRTFSSSQNIKPNIYVGGSNIKIRNCIIHDGNECIESFGGGVTELYGCLMYNGGYILNGGGVGHSIYTHNTGGIYNLYENNIFLASFNYGFHAHSSGANYIKNYHLKNNIFGKCNQKHTFGNDSGGIDYAVEDILFEYNENMNTWWWFNRWTNPARNIIVRNNYFTGYGTDYNNVDQGCCSFKTYDEIDCQNNVFANQSARLIRVKLPAGATQYTFGLNTYYSPDVSGVFMGQSDALLDFAGWEAEIGDTGSTISDWPPPDRIRVIPNVYDANRCHVAIYNFSGSDNVVVDVSAIYQPDEVIKVHQAQDFYNDIQTLTVAQDGTITIDMRAIVHSNAIPIGHNQTIDPLMCPYRGAFVVEKA